MVVKENNLFINVSLLFYWGMGQGCSRERVGTPRTGCTEQLSTKRFNVYYEYICFGNSVSHNLYADIYV